MFPSQALANRLPLSCASASQFKVVRAWHHREFTLVALRPCSLAGPKPSPGDMSVGSVSARIEKVIRHSGGRHSRTIEPRRSWVRLVFRNTQSVGSSRRFRCLDSNTVHGREALEPLIVQGMDRVGLLANRLKTPVLGLRQAGDQLESLLCMRYGCEQNTESRTIKNRSTCLLYW